MPTSRDDFAAKTNEEKILFCREEAKFWKDLGREVQKKVSFRTEAQIDTEISNKEDIVLMPSR